MSNKFISRNGTFPTTKMLILKALLTGNDFTCSELREHLAKAYGHKMQSNIFTYLYALADNKDIEIKTTGIKESKFSRNDSRCKYVYTITNHGKETYAQMRDDYIIRQNRINKIMDLPTIYDSLPIQKDIDKIKAIAK